MKNSRLAAALSTGVAALAIASLAHAQSAPADKPAATNAPDSAGLQEIIVTARRQNENLQKVPVFVSNYTGADLTAKGISSVSDLAQTAPNLYTTQAAGTSKSITIALRGQVQRESLLTLDPSVGVYVDDVYYARTYEVPANLLDVANVEVLNGPQGTLYGRNTSGGALKLTTVTADPTKGLTGFVKGSYGNYNAVTLSGAVNVPIVKDLLAIRYAGEYRNHDGYTTSYLVPIITNGVPNAIGVATSLTPIRAIKTDNENSSAHKLSLRFTPTTDIKLDVAGSLFHARDNGTAVFNPYGDVELYNFTASPSVFHNSPQRQANFYSGLTDVAPFSVVDVKSITGSLNWHFSDAVTAKAIVGYVQGSNISTANYDGAVNSGFSYLQSSPAINQKQHQLSEEFQLKGSLIDKKLEYVVGLYNFEEAGSEDPTGGTSIIFNSDLDQNAQFYARNRSRSAFGNLTFHVTDAIRLNGGVRYNSDRKFINASPRFAGNPTAFFPGDTGVSVGFPGTCVLNAGTPGVVATSTTNGGPCSLQTTATFNYATWEIGGDFQASHDVLLYGKISRGVRSGGENARIVRYQPPTSFTPEIVINYEVGVKSELFDRHVRFNASVFHDVLSNAQQSQIANFCDPNGANCVINSIVANRGGAKIDGVEAQLVVAPVARVTLTAGAGYNHFVFNDKTVVQPNDPPFTASASAAYNVPVSFGDIIARVDVNHISSYYFDTSALTPQNRLPGYTLLNARLGLTLHNGLEIAAFGRNLTGEHYYRGGSIALYTPDSVPFNAAAPGYWGTRGANTGAPRTYGVEATFKF